MAANRDAGLVRTVGTRSLAASMPTAVVIGIGSMLGAIALASQEEIIGLLALIAVCVVVYWLQTQAAVTQA